MYSLSIVVCTRNREPELLRFARSFQVARVPGDAELVIVDDGELSPETLAILRQITESKSVPFEYVRKSTSPGLWFSRIQAVRRTTKDLVAFFDDDVEIADDYLVRAVAWFDRDPDLAGVGGVDRLRPIPRWTTRVMDRLILYRSFRIGRRSLTGCNGGVDEWGAATTPFESDFVSGCNMVFRRDAIATIAPERWFAGYCPGEDLYLSAIAREHGKLVVDPGMSVRHHESPSSRDGRELATRALVVNHAHFLRRFGTRAARCLWPYTACGLMLESGLAAALRQGVKTRDTWSATRGYARGLRDLFRA